mmetsp:Transcript_6533/g.7469  ORF Transcript_6533/g.7469 Transcript_6533/m.7469 type:complete len:132 (+) Transcript_6533:113-508(+)
MIFSAALLRNHIRRATVQRCRQQSTHVAKPLIGSGALRTWYNVFGSSNAGYISWIVLGVLGCEVMSGTMSDSIWNSVNQGKTYESTDWSKFVVADDDDDDDDEDDEDGDEEEEGEGDGDGDEEDEEEDDDE